MTMIQNLKMFGFTFQKSDLSTSTSTALWLRLSVSSIETRKLLVTKKSAATSNNNKCSFPSNAQRFAKGWAAKGQTSASTMATQTNEELQQQLQQALEREEAARALNNGTYFTTIDELFGAEACARKNNLLQYNSLCRPLFDGQTPVPFEAYRLTFAAAAAAPSAIQAAVLPGQSRTSISTENARAIWEENVTGSASGEIAHLVPSSPGHANTYFFVTDFLFGYDENRTWATQERLIHGTNGENGRRRDNTGVKHMVANKFRLPNQKPYFDNNPCVLIIPCLSVEDAKGWSGQGYDAIMLIDVFPPQVYSSLADVARETGFTHDVFLEAVPTDIDVALSLMCEYTVGMFSAFCFQRQDCPIESITADYVLPQLRQGTPIKPVRKIHFSGHNNTDQGGGRNPAPDPILLVVKAIVNWNRRHYKQLVAAAEPDDEYVDELDELAERQYLEWRDQLRYPPQGPIGLEVTVVASPPPLVVDDDSMPTRAQRFTTSEFKGSSGVVVKDEERDRLTPESY
jgi:hypothetical protein